MAEHDGLTFAPVLIENLNAVLGYNLAHATLSLAGRGLSDQHSIALRAIVLPGATSPSSGLRGTAALGSMSIFERFDRQRSAGCKKRHRYRASTPVVGVHHGNGDQGAQCLKQGIAGMESTTDNGVWWIEANQLCQRSSGANAIKSDGSRPKFSLDLLGGRVEFPLCRNTNPFCGTRSPNHDRNSRSGLSMSFYA